MLSCEMVSETGIAVVEPKEPLKADDFKAVGTVVDPYIEKHGALKGLIIHVQKFPGWEDFAGMITHLRFVKDHHKHVKKVAVVTDDKIASVAPHIVAHLVSADMKHFPYDELEAAKQWIAGE